MANKRFWLGMLVMVLVFGMTLISCNNGTNDISDITYTVTADGNDTETTTKINFVFSMAVSGLTAEDIIIIPYAGTVSKGTLTGNGINWSLSITLVSPGGAVKVKIAKAGIENGEKTVTVYKGADTWTNVTSLSQINGTWNGLYTETQTKEGITINSVVEITFTINASTGTMSSSLKTTATYSGSNINMWWPSIKEALSEEFDTEASLTFNDSNHSVIIIQNILAEPISLSDIDDWLINQNGTKLKQPADYEEDLPEIIFLKNPVITYTTYTVTANGTSDTATTTQLNFVFSEAVGLTAENITIIADTAIASKGTLTGGGTDWNLSITVSKAGTVKVKINKTGIESGEKTVAIYRAEPSLPILPTFPSGFIGLWQRDEFTNTLTFTSTTLKASNQDLAWDLEVVSGDDYTSKYPTATGNRSTITIKLVSGNIEISGDSGTGENNWNGTWKKRSEFPSGFIGLWKRDEYANTLTFTSISLKASNQLNFWNLTDVSGDIYTIASSTNPATGGPLTIKLVSGNLEISGDSGTGENNWNGTWKEATPDGSSNGLAISLLTTQWKDGSVATGEAKWYKFEATSGTSYRVQWKDEDVSADYTAWIKVTAYQSNGTTNISTINGATSGWTNPRTISGVSGTVYLKVEPYSSSASYAGTYAIRFYNPAIVVPQIPITISSISATPSQTVVISWNSVLSTSGVSGYRVYRSSSETGTYTQIGADITSYLTTRYTDTNVSAGSTYWYKVAAYNSVGEGDKSDAKQSDTVPSTSVGTELIIGAAITESTLSMTTQVDWYKFTAVSGTTYNVQWADYYQKPDGSTYTGDIKVSAFTSDGTPITSIQNTDFGWTTPKTISGVSGTVYLKVEAYVLGSISKTGTYGIKVYQQ